MPVNTWIKIHETGDLGYLLHKRPKKVSKELRAALIEMWHTLYDEYIHEYGLPQEYEEYLRKRRYIAILKIKRMETGERVYNTFIRAAEADLKKTMTADKQGSFIDIIIAIEKYIHSTIDIDTLTVYKFYGYLRSIKQAAQRNG